VYHRSPPAPFRIHAQPGPTRVRCRRLRALGIGVATLRLSAGSYRVASAKPVPSDVAESDNAAWVHLTTWGSWKGHPDGEFEFGDAVFRQIVTNFKRQQTPVPFKYEHPDYVPDGSPVPSSGKIYDIRVDDDGLWGFTLFTDRAAEMIRAAEYEYCSVVVDFAAKDRVDAEEVGAELFEVGLTDHPFIDGQHPIRLPDLAVSEAA